MCSTSFACSSERICQAVEARGLPWKAYTQFDNVGFKEASKGTFKIVINTEKTETTFGDARLITLTGPGGTGRRGWRSKPHSSRSAIGRTACGSYRSRRSATRRSSSPTIAATVGASGDLREELRSRRLLLVLDNLEQLARGTADHWGSPGRVSRGAGAGDEQDTPQLVDRTGVSGPDAPACDAAELFVQRARMRKPSFERDNSVLEIAQRLDGLPLALELAAARIKVLSSAQILERLGQSLDVIGVGPADLPTRQRTLRATIDWSFDLLDTDEQALLRKLSVFAGGFDLEAAEVVGGGELETLASLVDKSLIRQAGEGRFTDVAGPARVRLGSARGCRRVVKRIAGTRVVLQGSRRADRAGSFGRRDIWR